MRVSVPAWQSLSRGLAHGHHWSLLRSISSARRFHSWHRCSRQSPGCCLGHCWEQYTIIVAAVSALVPFTLARRLGREWVESKLKGQRLDEAYQQSSGSQGFWFVVLMRAVPILPWEVQNYVAGLTKVSVPLFLLATMLGIIPGSFSLVLLGASVADPTPLQLTIAIGLKVATALVPVVAIYVRNRRAKKNASEGIAQ